MLFFQAFNQISDLYDLFRVKAHCWLVQYDNLRITEDCLGKPHPLTITFGKIFDQTVFHICNFYHIHDFFDHGFFLVFWDFFQIRCKFHIFQNGHIEIKRWLLGKITDAFFCLFRLFQNIMSVYGYCTFCRRDIAGDHIHCCRFSCAVGTKKSINFAFLYLKRKVVNCCMVSIPFDQIADFNH